MIILNDTNISDYLKKHVVSKLDFVKEGRIGLIKSVAGGLVSAVFRVEIDGVNIFLKQAIPGNLDKLKATLTEMPEDIFILFNDNRQLAEAKAIKAAEQILSQRFVPHLYFHDLDNHVMVLSEVCPGGHLFVDTMNEQINPKVAATLAKNTAILCNKTYNKIEKLRNDDDERAIRAVKYKYEVGTVWDGIKDPNNKLRAQQKADDFIKKSLDIYRVLVLGDYYERNILVNGDDCAAVDFEEGHIGDPIEDIGKLLASYCLRVIYFEAVRQDAYASIINILENFFSTLNIPEDKSELERRLKVMTAGVMLLSVDGLRKNWLPWVQNGEKSGKSRELALALILDDSSPVIDIITEFNKKL